MLRWIWPSCEDLDSSKEAALNGAKVAFFVAVGTSIVAFLHIQGILKIFEGMGAEAFVDAGLFFVIGIGLLKISRVAAVAGLLLYIAEQCYMFRMIGRPNFMGILFSLVLLGAVRGSFAYHRFKKASEEVGPMVAVSPVTGKPLANQPVAQTPPAAAGPVAPQEISKGAPKKKILIVALLAFAVAAAVTAFWVLSRRSGNSGFSSAGGGGSEAPGDSAAGSGSAEGQDLAGMRVFRLKTGEVVQGQVVYEDDVYYTVETSRGKEKIVIKDDMAEG